MAAATVMDGFALPAIDALPSRNAISKAPRAAGYRGSDFVPLALNGKSLIRRRLSGAGGTAVAPAVVYADRSIAHEHRRLNRELGR